MKKLLAFLMAVLMTVAMVPMTAFASTNLTAVDEVQTLIGEDNVFTSRVELSKSDDQVGVEGTDGDKFEVILKLTNGKFAKDENNDYIMEATKVGNGVYSVDVKNDTAACVTLSADTFNGNSSVPGKKVCVLDIVAYAVEVGDVVATFTSNVSNFKKASEVIATAYENNILIESEGITTFENGETAIKALKPINLKGFFMNTPKEFEMSFKLMGNYEFSTSDNGKLLSLDGEEMEIEDFFSIVNSEVSASYYADEDEIVLSIANENNLSKVSFEGNILRYYADEIKIGSKYSNGSYTGEVYYLSPSATVVVNGVESKLDEYQNLVGGPYLITLFRNPSGKVEKIILDDIVVGSTFDNSFSETEYKNFANNLFNMHIENVCIQPTENCNLGDLAKITVSSKEFASAVEIKVANMGVMYGVQNGDLPLIIAGNNRKSRTLKILISENSGDIINTSRKATFTFPEGIEVEAIYDHDNYPDFDYEINDNIVEIRDYGIEYDSDVVDLAISFDIKAPSDFPSGDVIVTLGGEFDDVQFKVATVKGADRPVESAKDIDLVPIIYKGTNFSAKIKLAKPLGSQTVLPTDVVNGTDVFDVQFGLINGKFNRSNPITLGHGVIDYKVTGDNSIILKISTDIFNDNRCSVIFNSSPTEIGDLMVKFSSTSNGFPQISSIAAYSVDKYTNLSTSDSGSNSKSSHSLSNVKKVSQSSSGSKSDENNISDETSDNDGVTSAQLNSPTIKMSIGDTYMTVGNTLVSFDSSPYINKENRSMFPIRAISEAFGATVNWDESAKEISLEIDSRLVSMHIGSNVMYINGTPTTMNTSPEIKDSRAFIPIRDIANAIGIDNIIWDEHTKTVIIN